MSRKKPAPTAPGQLAFDLEKPVFVTWKKYGFRHIVAEEDAKPGTAYLGRTVRTTEVTGKALCGATYSWIEYPDEQRPSYYDTFDKRSPRRPLCGHCRRKWLRITSQQID